MELVYFFVFILLGGVAMCLGLGGVVWAIARSEAEQRQHAEDW